MRRLLHALFAGCALCACLVFGATPAFADDWGDDWGSDSVTDPVVEDTPAPMVEDAWEDPVAEPEPVPEPEPEPEPIPEPEPEPIPEPKPESESETPAPADAETTPDPVTDADDKEDAPLVPPQSMQQLTEESRDDVRTIMLTHNHDERTRARDHLIRMGEDGIPGAMMLIQDKVQLSRIYGVVILREIAVNTGLQGSAKQVPAYLLRLLGDHDPMVRHNASMALRKITGQFFDYHFDAPESQRRQAIVRWHRYLLEQGLVTAGE